jgi:hypothetical protein
VTCLPVWSHHGRDMLCLLSRQCWSGRNEEVSIPRSMGYSVCLMISIRLLYASRSSSFVLVSYRLHDDGCEQEKDGIVVATDAQQAAL